MSQKRLLTVKEAAEYLGLASQTVYNAISRKADGFCVKPIRIGKKPLFDLRDLDAWIESQKDE